MFIYNDLQYMRKCFNNWYNNVDHSHLSKFMLFLRVKIDKKTSKFL